ncbi:MAG: replication initiator protein A [Eubacterium ramulus]
MLYWIIFTVKKPTSSLFSRSRKYYFTDDKYKGLPCEAKMLYGMMLDRMSLSIEKSMVFDEQKRGFY